MVSLDQNELIGVIALILQGIHHNIIVFYNISCIWEQDSMHAILMQTELFLYNS